MADPVLVGDIGGTNARFALTKDNNARYHCERVYDCQDFTSPEAAIRQYLQEVNHSVPSQCCLAAAGPVNGDAVALTNNHWHLNAQELKSCLNIAQVRLINDFEAVAHCVPALAEEDRLQVGPVVPGNLGTDYNIAVLGPGTGLGVATLAVTRGKHLGFATEGGHVGFAPESEQQQRVLSRLTAKYKRVSTERLLSGQGIENLYWALGDEPSNATVPSAATIFEQLESDPRAKLTASLFFRILGQVAGDLALATGAFDGIYLAGGIAQRYANQLAASDFRAGFERKGRHTELMQSIPTTLITHKQPGLLGAAVAASI